MQNYIMQNIVEHFQFEGTPIYIEPYGQGHINATFAVYFKSEKNPPHRYIIQKINTRVFKNPHKLMENIDNVTSFLRKKIIAAGGDPERETLTVIPTKDNQLCYEDQKGDFYRAYIFIEHATSYQTAERPILFRNAAKSFGKFQKLLSDYPADTLFETIEKFHDTRKRFQDFLKAAEEDKMGRAHDVAFEIDFIKSREKDCAVIADAIDNGELPLRVTHNDTKLNNIMMDNVTDEGLCVIDLDTVMPGSILYDFGDSIRFGASSAAEDEKDLEKVYMDIELFEEYTEGYLSEAGAAMTDKELALLAFGAKIMTLECGMRFLADYLEGDVYFHTTYEGQNLDRARTQLKLVADMEKKMAHMNEIVANIAKR